MAAKFIEVSDRLDNTRKMSINTNEIVKLTDDGKAVITVKGLKGIEVHKLDETYAAVKTLL